MSVYEFDPDQADDGSFVPAQLEHLVLNSRGRLLDARRTPVVVVGVDPGRGSFEVEIQAFEDQGTRWELGLDELRRFQFPESAPSASAAAVAALVQARERFAITVHIDTEASRRAETLEAIALAQQRAAARLSASGAARTADLNRYIRDRRGEPLLTKALEAFLIECGVDELDQAFTRSFVSNPRAGEIVKGHAIVLAELGLCPYHGGMVRDPDVLRAPWSREARRTHLIARLAFARALWAFWNVDAVMLYRAAAADTPFRPDSERASFVSATFSSEVSAAHFEGGPSTVAAGIWRQRLPVDRILMTFLETAALNEQFLEAEAILIADPANTFF